ncbi:hypothetical protein, partial [Escherichia coli]|uniref:hypothetical protein n=1 Tax=Escherichia coli TaxID=562 RepID=UPI001BB47F48
TKDRLIEAISLISVNVSFTVRTPSSSSFPKRQKVIYIFMAAMACEVSKLLNSVSLLPIQSDGIFFPI